MVDLDLDGSRGEVVPKDAATLVLVRDVANELEVFCVERHKKSGFLGGAIVFPGGKLDATDEEASWSASVTESAFVGRERALAIAACRESLEEAAILPIEGNALRHDDLIELRAHAKHEPLRALLERRRVRVDVARMRLFARWITPVEERRRFDTRFFIAAAPEGQPGAHDEQETMASFWATPREVLARFDRDEVQLAPPTHRTLDLLARARDTAQALGIADGACLEPICPRLVRHVTEELDTLALALPGDPEHEVKEPRIAGASRFVLHGRRWLPGAPP
jgi:8-oxo-dGTP pyrophosphatase MutT (NUDIX family)